MGKTKKRQQHSLDKAITHLREHHPGCPDDIMLELANRIASRTWRTRVTLGHAAGIVTSTYVRHRLTDYDRLFRIKGLTREEARLIVAPEVKAILDAWRRRPSPIARHPMMTNDPAAEEMLTGP